MATSIKHALLVILGIAAPFLTWPYAADWMHHGGNILNLVQFFADAIKAGGTASFLSVDMAIAWIVFMIWVVSDTRRIGMGVKWGWFFVALSLIGVSLAFPIYLVSRERFLMGHRRRGKADTDAASVA